MNKMKTTIAVALAACVSTQVFAQSKQDVITFALTGSHQSSVSTSASKPNYGNWSDGPMFYKTTTAKLTDQNIIQFIGYVLYHNAKHYSAKAKLVLVQGELSGFFNITPDLASSDATRGTYPNQGLTGDFTSADGDSDTSIRNSTDSTFVQLDNGHHFLVNATAAPVGTAVAYPVGHMQPWGQIYIQDPGSSTTAVSCDNVTYFFAITVEECYDCFYMNSFISDATFKINTTTSPLPCCGNPATLLGSGKDRYYMTMSFDNTQNNPYLYNQSSCYVGVLGIGPTYPTGGSPIPGDGVIPDQINNPHIGPHYYNDSITFLLAKSLPYEARFTLSGILTYTWALKYVSSGDIAPDFVGTGSYAANGYGFIGLYCSLLTGTGSFKESIVKTPCCTGQDWWDNTTGNGEQGWYGVGAEYVTDGQGAGGYVSKYVSDYAAGAGSLLPGSVNYYQTPMNASTSLSFHQSFDKANYPWNNTDPNITSRPSGWDSVYPDNGVVTPLFF